MKPFDLKAALEGKKVVTRDGREVDLVRIDFEAIEKKSLPLLYLIGKTDLRRCLLTGRVNFSKDSPHSCDLFMADEEVVEYWNMYRCMSPGIWSNEVDAKHAVSKNQYFQGTLRITLVDGKITKAEVI